MNSLIINSNYNIYTEAAQISNQVTNPLQYYDQGQINTTILPVESNSSGQIISASNPSAPNKDTSKRRQVKNACVNCQKACKKCDEGRPCQRCIKLGISDTCVDSPRKERKKGFKRGPYKKKIPQANEKVIRKSRTVKNSVISPPALLSHNIKVEKQSLPVIPNIEVNRLSWSSASSGQYCLNNYYQDRAEYNSYVKKSVTPATETTVVVPSHNIGSPDSPDSSILDTIQFQDNMLTSDPFPFNAFNHDFTSVSYNSNNYQYEVSYSQTYQNREASMNNELKTMHILYDNAQHLSIPSSQLINNQIAVGVNGQGVIQQSKIAYPYSDNHMKLHDDFQWINAPIIPSTYAYHY